MEGFAFEAFLIPIVFAVIVALFPFVVVIYCIVNGLILPLIKKFKEKESLKNNVVSQAAQTSYSEPPSSQPEKPSSPSPSSSPKGNAGYCPE